MSFLNARTVDGSLRRFVLQELAYFFADNGRVEADARHAQREFRLPTIVFGGGLWFIGGFEIDDFRPGMVSYPGRPNSDRCPAPPYPSLDPPYTPPKPGEKREPVPHAATRVISYHHFHPTGLFHEIEPAAAVDWLYKHVGHIPSKAQAALDKSAPPVAPAVETPKPHEGEAPEPLPDLVTLDQAAAAVHRGKRTLERRKTKGTLPPPLVEGGGGKPDLWEWSVIGPWLTREFAVILPARYPANR